jgi:2-(1,2-epoxy-1,2-dihydrophenyl)acetyl-CoA isomerase
MMETVAWTLEDGIATLVLSRPDKLNSFTVQMHRDLAEALSAIEARPDLEMLVITGAGRAFSAGQDLSERVVPDGAPMPDLGESLGQRYNPLLRRIAAMRVPTIAAVNGVAVGAGVGLAAACDVVLATRQASFRLPASKLGLLPDAGATWTLPRTVGAARGAGTAMLGGTIGAEEALQLGIVWRVVEDADELAVAVAQTVAQIRANRARAAC